MHGRTSASCLLHEKDFELVHRTTGSTPLPHAQPSRRTVPAWLYLNACITAASSIPKGTVCLEMDQRFWRQELNLHVYFPAHVDHTISSQSMHPTSESKRMVRASEAVR